MKYLVRCVCGHGLDRHNADGCTGDTRFHSCACRRDQDAALESAIGEARSNPETWRLRNEGEGTPHQHA